MLELWEGMVENLFLYKLQTVTFSMRLLNNREIHAGGHVLKMNQLASFDIFSTQGVSGYFHLPISDGRGSLIVRFLRAFISLPKMGRFRSPDIGEDPLCHDECIKLSVNNAKRIASLDIRAYLKTK